MRVCAHDHGMARGSVAAIQTEGGGIAGKRLSVRSTAQCSYQAAALRPRPVYKAKTEDTAIPVCVASDCGLVPSDRGTIRRSKRERMEKNYAGVDRVLAKERVDVRCNPRRRPVFAVAVAQLTPLDSRNGLLAFQCSS